ncbi:MAG: type II toxin-antitoxin system VapC family toxin [Candidatus Lustribacter sp.]
MIAIDASAAYESLLSERADAVLESTQQLVAPDIIVGELLNARWKSVRSHVPAPSVDAILGFLKRVRVVPCLAYATEAAELAERLNHPVYDCFYIAVARRETLKLLTIDAHLTRKLRTHKLGSLLA